MTPHGKANNIAHNTQTPLTIGATASPRTPVEGSVYDNFAATGKIIRRNCQCGDHSSLCAARTRYASPYTAFQPVRVQPADRLPRSSRAPAARSTVLFVYQVRGVASWWGNQARGTARRQISGRTKMSAKISGRASGEFPSAISPGSQPLARPNTILPSARAKTRDRHADGCGAIMLQLLPSMLSWPTSSPGSNDGRAA